MRYAATRLIGRQAGLDIVGHRTWVAILARQASFQPTKVAIDFEGTAQLTYGELIYRARRLAAGLQSRGIRRGDGVALYLDTSLDFVVSLVAAHWLGAVVIPISTRYKPDEVLWQFDDARPKLAIVGAAYLPVMRTADTERTPILISGIRAADDPRALEAAMEDRALPPAAALEPNETAAVMYTSGSTARPRGVILTHGNYVWNAALLQHLYGFSSADTTLNHFPLYHMNGHNYQLVTHLCSGATSVLYEKFSASRFAEQVLQHGITVTNLNATHVKMVLSHPSTADERPNRLRFVKTALSLEDRHVGEFEERFGTQLLTSYSQTETIAPNAYNPGGAQRKAQSIGIPSPGYRVRLIDGDGNEVGAGHTGEITISCISDHGICGGYFGDTESTAAAWDGQWWRTGDLAVTDVDGYLYFSDRKKDMIKHSGFNVAPAEVERVLKEHPAVAECVVVGIPDPMKEEAIKAFVVLRTQAVATSEELMEHCRRSLADYKVPTSLDFLEELPVNNLGKTDKRLLRGSSH